jgi:hypothetical protein
MAGVAVENAEALEAWNRGHRHQGPLSAGFTDVAFRRSDLSLRIGRDLDEAVAFNVALGPAAEVIRLAGAEADSIRPRLESLLREALADFETPDGTVAASSTWIVTARVPSTE